MIQAEFNKHMVNYDRWIRAFRSASYTAEEAENAYRAARAKFKVRATEQDVRMSQAAAETLADADDEIMHLRLAYKKASADVEAWKQKLKWAQDESNRLRSAKVDERESNRLYAENPAGA